MVHIEPLGSSVDGSGAFRRFKNVLLDSPAERERWFAFRAERLGAAVCEWLAQNKIEGSTRSAAPR